MVSFPELPGCTPKLPLTEPSVTAETPRCVLRCICTAPIAPAAYDILTTNEVATLQLSIQVQPSWAGRSSRGMRCS